MGMRSSYYDGLTLHNGSVFDDFILINMYSGSSSGNRETSVFVRWYCLLKT